LVRLEGLEPSTS